MGYESRSVDAPNDVLRSLADPTRRAILEHLLRDGELNVTALTARAGVSQAAVSKHLSVLKHAGLVHDRPQGRTVHYTANPQGLAPLIDWIQHYSTFWQDRLHALEHLLDTMDQDA
ncbi:ArsR/SmtB family transcription factor [Deinococcus pimensis]|uniref:ArsR/SmtB family transcription factor n=1 Tax=Deinococcus pimensis TaxID=309888 RepID=UPI000481B6F0|nr:metalloregulator ArsR/SmtB family transcription factor [Deinococcus pimensis]